MDLDAWLDSYNLGRPHSGRFCHGKTPWETFQQSKHLVLAKDLSRRADQLNTVTADIKMCKNAEMELTQPKVVASSADTPWRCVRQIAKGGSSERDLREVPPKCPPTPLSQ